MATNRRGFFLKPNGPITTQTNIPSSGLGWSKKAIVKITSSTAVRFLNRYGSNVLFAAGSEARYTKSGTTSPTSLSYSYPTNSTPFEWEVKTTVGGSGQAVVQFYKDSGENPVNSADAANNDGSTFSNNIILDGADFPNAEISYLEAHNSDGTSIQTFDANKVLNAAGDGFVDRLQADYGNVAAATDYNLFLYDTSDPSSPHHATVPAGSTWTLDIDFNETVGSVKAWQAGVILTFSGGFQPTSATIGGYPCEITNSGSGSVTLSFPALDTVNSYPKFGNQVLAVTDSLGNQITQIVDWQAPEGFDYTTLLTDGDVLSNASMFYQWGEAGTLYADAEAPVAGDQVVYELQYIKNVTAGDVENDTKSGIMTIADNAPSDWNSTAYLIDDVEVQSFNIDSGVSAPPVPTVVNDTLPQTITVNTPVNVESTVSNADSVLWTSNLEGTFEDATLQDTVFTPTESGSHTLTITGTNANGSASDSFVLTVEEPAVLTPPTAVIQNGSRTVDEGSRLYLYSTGSIGGSGTITGYQWSNDAGLVINNPNAAQCDLDPTPMVGQSFNVTLTVTNSNGDTDSVTETITVADITKPVIGLIGGAVELVINGTFTDPGANVTDNVDADTIIYSSDTVDVNTLGDQVLSYNYTDAAGNVADTVTRTVTIVEAPTGPTAGVVQSTILVNEGDSFTLDGTASLAGDTPIVTYLWKQISGADTAITNPISATTTQIAPDVELDSTLSFRLTVTDENALSSSTNVTVSVQYVADPPSPFLDILELVSAWTVDKDSNITAYRGRANREILRFRPDAESSEGLELTAEGFLDLEGNDIVYLEVIMDGATNKLSTKTDSVKVRRDRLIPRMGDFIFPGKLSNRIVTVIAYVQGDTRGVVLSTEGSTTGIIKANTFIDVAVE